MVRRMVCIMLIAVLASGCGKLSIISDSGEVHSLEQRDERVIEFWHTYSDEESRIFEEELIPLFERTYPGIKIKPVRLVNNNELKYSLIARSSSNRGPDVVRMDIAWIPELSQSRLLLPLNQFPDFGEIKEGFRREVMDVGYYNNQYYSLPLNMNTKIGIFNRELLRKAGLTEPPRTLKETLDIARLYHYKIGMGGLETWKILPYIYGMGGVMTDPSYSRATGYLNGEATVQAVELLFNLYKDGIIERSAINGGGNNWEGVRGGNVLMTDEGPWYYSILKGPELVTAIKLTSRTSFPEGTGTFSILGGENLVIMKRSKEPEAAWQFVKWMTAKEAQLMMAQTGLIPTNKEAAKALNVVKDSFIFPYVEALEHPFLRPPVKRWSKIDEIFTQYMRKIFQGDLTAREGLNRAAAEIDLLLTDND